MIVVTGGSGGIGSAICSRFIQHGHFVAVIDQTPPKHERIDFFQSDLSNEGAVTKVIREIYEKHGSINSLINCIGFYQGSTLDEFSWEEFKYSYQINLCVPIEAILEWLNCRSNSERGVVVNIGSAGARVPSSDLAYATSKAALEGASRSLAKSLASKNVSVFCVAPGVVDTEMSKRVSKSRRDEHLDKTFLKRACTPDEVADLVWFLVTGKTDYMTGTVINLSGGLLSC